MIYRLGVKSDDAEIEDHGVDSAHANPRVWIPTAHARFGPNLGAESTHAEINGSASNYGMPSLGTSSLRGKGFQYVPGVGVNWLNAEVPTLGVCSIDAELLGSPKIMNWAYT